jgi:VWFA-related protein
MGPLTFPLLVFAALAGTQQQDSDIAPPVFRMEVSLITVDAKVTGRDGRDLNNLDASDFVVFDEGQRQKLTHFGRETTPVDLLLVLDVSSSMRPFLLELTPQVTDVLSPLRSGDRAGVMLFADRSEVVQSLTNDLLLVPRTTVSTIYKNTRGQRTLLNSALVNAAQYLKSQPATGRRTIIVLTDNYAEAGPVTDNDVIRELHAANAVLNMVLVGAKGTEVKMKPTRYGEPDTAPDIMRIAKATGGEVVTGAEPARALRHAIEQATTRYSLQYPAPPGEPGTFRHIQVDLSAAARARYPDAVVQARSGYDVPK